MKIFKYWVKETLDVQLEKKKIKKDFFFGSNISLQDAKDKFNVEKNKLVEAFINFTKQKRDKRIDVFREYESNIVEPLIKEINIPDITAYITRNHYGSEVLCVDKVMFLDIDYANVWYWDDPFPRHKGWSKFLSHFFIKTKTYKQTQIEIDKFKKRVKEIELNYKTNEETEAKILYVLESLLKNKYTDLNFKVYRTRMGLRLIETTRLWEPKSQEVWTLMKDFMCDNVYMLFCLRQNCFRARLTPKPWRVKMTALNMKYPFDTKDDEAAYDRWVDEYQQKKNLKNVSDVFCQLGTGVINPSLQEIIDVHDNYFKVFAPGKKLG